MRLTYSLNGTDVVLVKPNQIIGRVCEIQTSEVACSFAEHTAKTSHLSPRPEVWGILDGGWDPRCICSRIAVSLSKFTSESVSETTSGYFPQSFVAGNSGGFDNNHMGRAPPGSPSSPIGVGEVPRH